jgi:hypothetical protein
LAQRKGWSNVTLIHGDARKARRVDGRRSCHRCLLYSFVLSAVPDWEDVFMRGFALLRAGGRCAILDLEEGSGSLAMSNGSRRLFWRKFGAAEISRRSWELLSKEASDFEYGERFGGLEFIAAGMKS